MRLFLDTANIDDIRKAARLGVISGITTNPSLVAREASTDLRSAVLEICGLINGPISVEVVRTDVDGMLDEGRSIATWHPNVVVKIPCTANGLEAISVLSREGISVNMTLCFSANQALLGALAGATYISPFVGRLDDIGHDGMQVVAESVEIFQRHNLSAQVLAASIRHPLHCVMAARAGAHVATSPFKVLVQMTHHPLTDIGLAKFTQDWQKVAKK